MFATQSASFHCRDNQVRKAIDSSPRLQLTVQVGISDVRLIQLPALNGDMIVDRGESLSWFDGPTPMEILEITPRAHTEHYEPYRFPLQYVRRPQDSANPELHDNHGFMGRVKSGSIKVGDKVTVLPNGLQSTVKSAPLSGIDHQAVMIL